MSGAELSFVFFVLFFVFLLLGVPITFSLGLGGLVALVLSGARMTLLIKSMFSPFESFTLLAIFLFTMMGVIYQRSGMASLLCDALVPVIGRVKGGLALVMVYASALFGALTGSANATCATFSKLIGPEMVRTGYPRDWTAAVIASASPLGSLIPPSITCIVLGVTTGTSIGTLFMVDFAIGLLTIVALNIVIIYVAYKHNYGGDSRRYTLGEICSAIAKMLPLISVPVIVIGGMYGGIFTATEAGAIGSLASILLAVCYGKMTLRDFYETIIDSAGTTAMVLLLIAASYIVSYVMSFSGINQAFVRLLVTISEYHPIMGLLFLFAILLILGCFIDLIVVCIVLAPTAITTLAPFGINPYHLCALFLIGNLVAIITPPVGVALFTASSILNEKIERVSIKILPFVVMYIIITLILIFIPDASLWLPKMLGMSLK